MTFLIFFSKVDHKMLISTSCKIYITYVIYMKKTGRTYFKKAFQPRPQHILPRLKAFGQNFHMCEGA